MPLPPFLAKFSGKKTVPPRKNSTWLSENGIKVVDRTADFRELSEEVSLKLGGAVLNLDHDGRWNIENSNQLLQNVNERIRFMRQEKQAISEENNLLNFKIELLLDLITEYKMECDKKDKEINRLKQNIVSGTTQQRNQ